MSLVAVSENGLKCQITTQTYCSISRLLQEALYNIFNTVPSKDNTNDPIKALDIDHEAIRA